MGKVLGTTLPVRRILNDGTRVEGTFHENNAPINVKPAGGRGGGGGAGQGGGV